MFLQEQFRIDEQRSVGSSREWSYWMENAIPGIEIEVDAPTIVGIVETFDFAGARLWSIKSGAQMIRRKRRCGGGRFQPMAIVQVEGSTVIRQYDTARQLEPGDFTFVDAAMPIELEELSDFQHLYVQFPPRLFSEGGFQLAAVKETTSGWAVDRCFVNCIRDLWEAASQLSPRDHATALGAVTSLATMTSPFQQAENDISTPVRVTRAMAFIEHNLGELWLTPMAVAEAQNVSRRYLDDLFLQKGFRVESWIWERRLQRARDELKLYAQYNGTTKKTILQIALDLGFKNPSHFTRVFSNRFGMVPREYRKQFSTS